MARIMFRLFRENRWMYKQSLRKDRYFEFYVLWDSYVAPQLWGNRSMALLDALVSFHTLSLPQFLTSSVWFPVHHGVNDHTFIPPHLQIRKAEIHERRGVLCASSIWKKCWKSFLGWKFATKNVFLWKSLSGEKVRILFHDIQHLKWNIKWQLPVLQRNTLRHRVNNNVLKDKLSFLHKFTMIVPYY